MRCYHNKGYDYGAFCKNFEEKEIWDEEAQMNLDTAWCNYHNCPCKDLGYSCSNYESDPEQYAEIDKSHEEIAQAMKDFVKACERKRNTT